MVMVFSNQLKVKIVALCCLFSTTQQAVAQSMATITGKAKNQNNEVVVGATVILAKVKNGNILKSAITDAEGKFELENVKFDTCKLTISYVGGTTYTSETLILSPQNPLIDIGSVVLVPSNTELQAVSVTAQKSFIVRKIDRTIVTPDALISNAGVSSLEVLEKAPGITIDANGAISLKGKTGVVVFIDDKPAYLVAADLATYLRSIPSGTIESIEIMTNPPAKYDAAGNAGVINIKLKKNRSMGFSGAINLAYGQGRHSRTNNSLNFNYRINKFNFFSNLSVTQNNSYQDLTITRRYFTPTGALNSTFTQNSLLEPKSGGQNLKVGIDFYATQKTTIGFVLSGFINPTNRAITNKADITDGKNDVTGRIIATDPVDMVLKNGAMNLNFSHKIDAKGKELSANIDNIHYESTLSQVLTNTTFTPDRIFLNESILASSLPSNIDIKTAKMDYTHPLTDGGKVETGLKTSFVNTNNTADFFDVTGANRVVNNEFSNTFQYDENINAAYLNYAKDFKRWSVQVGLRFENTNIKGHQLGNAIVKDSSFTRAYSHLFPTFYLSYKLDTMDRHQFGLSVGRRIDRPNYKDMNPFTYPIDRFTYYGGNPFLKPTFSINIELSHTFKNFLTTTFEYSEANDVISETNEQRGNIYFSRPGNFAKQIAYGISVSGSYPVTKWWTIQLYTAVMNNTFKSPIYTEQLDESRVYWVVMPTNQFVINKLWSTELAGNYQTYVLSGQFLVHPIGAIRAGVSRKILKEKGTLKLNLSDVFYTNQIAGDIRNIANASANWFSYLDSRVGTLSFSYRFSKGQTLKVRQSGASESEQKRVKS
jgi:iron complex outermembrane recepter protein